MDGVALGLTDLAADPRTGLLFCAAAEAGASTYEDGVCTGSVIGTLSLDGEIRSSARTAPRRKLEGIAIFAGTEPATSLWLVADPDDRSQPAPLFRCGLSGSGLTKE